MGTLVTAISQRTIEEYVSGVTVDRPIPLLLML